jgi:hypothetical protein
MFRHLGAAALLALLVPAGAQAQEIKALAMFGGNELVVLQPNMVNPDCSSGPLPDVRLALPAANGSVRMDQGTVAVNRPRTDPRSICNGKQVDALNVSYRANEGFVGVERLVLRADFHNGNMREFVVLIDIR